MYPVSSATPGVALEEGTPAGKDQPEGSVTRSKSEKAAAEEGAAQVKEATAKTSLVKDEGKVHKGEAHARVARERKMRARAVRMAERLAHTQSAIAERHKVAHGARTWHDTNTKIHTSLSDVM